MQQIQKAILDYSLHNRYLSPLVTFSSILALLFPIYAVASRVLFLSFLWKYIGMFSAIMYLAYYAGTILCFAKNQLVPLDIAFCCMTVNSMFDLQYGVSLNQIAYIAFYAMLAGICIAATNHTSQWGEFKGSTYQKVAQCAERAGDALLSKQKDYTFCPKCGNRCSKGTKFCHNCGTPTHL